MKLKLFVAFLAVLVIPSVVLAAGNCTKDGGKDYNTAGISIAGTDQYPDQCIDEVTLEEYYCEANGLEYEYYTCPTSCVDGACTGGTNETTNETTPPPCVEDWKCNDWSSCVNSQQTRTCTDANDCGTTLNKPVEAQTCNPVTPPTTSGVVNYRYYIIGGIILLLIILYFVFRKKPEVKEVPKTEEKKTEEKK